MSHSQYLPAINRDLDLDMRHVDADDLSAMLDAIASDQGLFRRMEQDARYIRDEERGEQ